MVYLFNDKGDVAIFFSLITMLFAEVFAGIVHSSVDDKNSEWYDYVSKRIRFMPPRYVFPIAWTLIFTFISIGMFLFYRNETYPNTGYVVDSVTILLVMNLMVTKLWTYVFFQLKKTAVALAMIAFIIVTGVTIVGILSARSLDPAPAHGIWPEPVIFACYMLWCAYAFYINYSWWSLEKQDALRYADEYAYSTSHPLRSPYQI